MNCVLYARVSTEKQQELSIPAQLQAMREYAQRQQWTVLEEFIEHGVSARTTDRPALRRLLATIRNRDAAVEVVVVHKIDRLARNVADHATIRAVLKQQGARLASVVENVDDSVSGQLVENIMASIAQFYSGNLGEEVKKGLKEKIQRGEWPHLPPVGYVQVRNQTGRGSHVEIHPRIGPLVARMFELYATGHYSLHALAERMAAEGLYSKRGNRLSQAQVLRVLSNPFYAGILRWHGHDWPGCHALLTPLATFERAQDVIRQRYRYVGMKKTVPGFPLRGWAVCAACRGRMTSERHDKWRYYRCSRQSYKRDRCNAKFCNADRAHQDLERICGSLQLTRKHAASIRKAARAFVTERAANHHAHLDRVRREQRALMESERQLADAFANADITPRRFADGIEEIRRDQRRVRQEEQALSQDPAATMQAVDRFLDLSTSMADMYRSLSSDLKVQFLKTIFDRIILGPSGVVSYTLTSKFQAIACTDLTDPERHIGSVIEAAS